MPSGSSYTSGMFFFSIIKGAYTTIPTLQDGKVKIGDVCSAIESQDSFGPSVVKRSAEIMDGITEDQIDECRETFGSIKLNYLHSAGIYLGDDRSD